MLTDPATGRVKSFGSAGGVSPRGDRRMGERGLAPEVRLGLQIQLDRLTQVNEQCRIALDSFSTGDMGREEYLQLVRKQHDIQAAWERKNRDCRSARQS